MKITKYLPATLALAAASALAGPALATETFNPVTMINGLSAPVDVAVSSHPWATQSRLFIAQQGTASVVRYNLNSAGVPQLNTAYTFPVTGPVVRAVAVNDIPGHPCWGQVYVASGDVAGTWSLIEAYKPNGVLFASNIAALPYVLRKVVALAVDREGFVYAADENSKLNFCFDFGWFQQPGSVQMLPHTTYKPVAGLPADITVTESRLVLHVDSLGNLMASNFNGTDFFNLNNAVPQVGGTSIDAHDLAERLWVSEGDYASFFTTFGSRYHYPGCYENNGVGMTLDGVTSPSGQGAFTQARRIEARCFWNQKIIMSQPTAQSFERVFVADPAANRVSTYLLTHASNFQPTNNVARWRFDELGSTVIDSVNANHGSFAFSSQPLRTEGFVRKGLTFSTGDDGVLVPDNATLDFGTGSYSLECWVRTCDDLGIKSIIEKREWVGSAPVGYSLYLINGTIGFQIACNNSWFNFIPSSTGFVADGNWHHLAATVNRNTNIVRLYVDGTQAHVASIPATVQGNVDNAADLMMATHPFSGFPLGMAEELDEVSLYNKCLSPAEVQTIATARCAGRPY